MLKMGVNPGAASLLTIAALVFGPVATWLAARRRRNRAVWLGFGAILGPVALILLVLAPPADCPACGEQTAGFVATCPACGVDTKRPGDAIMTSGFVGQPVMDRPDALERVGADRDGRWLESTRRSLPSRVDAGVESLTAVGARRPALPYEPTEASRLAGNPASRPDITILASGVFVRGTQPLLAGSRYLIARTRDRLVIIGPVEHSPEHIEIDLPLAGMKTDLGNDHVVLSGSSDGWRGRRFVLAFQAVAPLTTTPLDLLLEAAGPILDASISS